MDELSACLSVWLKATGTMYSLSKNEMSKNYEIAIAIENNKPTTINEIYFDYDQVNAFSSKCFKFNPSNFSRFSVIETRIAEAKCLTSRNFLSTRLAHHVEKTSFMWGMPYFWHSKMTGHLALHCVLFLRFHSLFWTLTFRGWHQKYIQTQSYIIRQSRQSDTNQAIRHTKNHTQQTIRQMFSDKCFFSPSKVCNSQGLRRNPSWGLQD